MTRYSLTYLNHLWNSVVQCSSLLCIYFGFLKHYISIWRIYTSTYCRICLWTILNQKIVLHVFWYCHNKVDRMVHLQPIENRSVHYYNISFEDYYQSVARTFLITHKGQNVFGWWCYPKPWGAKVIIDLNGHYCSTVVS